MKRGLATLAAVLLGLFLLRAAIMPSLSGPEAPLPTKATWLKRASRAFAPAGSPQPDFSDEPESPPLKPAAVEADGAFDVTVIADGKALAGVDVRVYFGERHDWYSAGRTRTDTEGRARVLARPGAYLIVARHNGFAPAERRIQRAHGEPTTRTTLLLEHGSTLKGVTVQEDGKPVALAEISLGDETPIEERVAAKSNGRGEFTIANLRPSRYVLEAHAATFATARATANAPQAEPVRLVFSAASFLGGRVVHKDGTPVASATVIAAGAHEVRTETNKDGAFSLELGAGRYFLGAIAGAEAGSASSSISLAPGATQNDVLITLGAPAQIFGTLTHDGTPVVGARVEARLNGRAGSRAPSISDQAGRYTLSPIAPGNYDVEVLASGFAPFVENGISVGEGQRFPLDVALTPNTSLEGTVTTASGSPIAGAIVSQKWKSEAVSDAQGHYLLPDLAPGAQRITARWRRDASGFARIVDVKPGSRADFVLGDLGTVEGTVTQDGQAVVGAEVFALPTSGEWPDVRGFRSDAQGHYRLGVQPGEYHFGASLGPRLPEKGSYSRGTIAVGETRTVDLQLPTKKGRVIGTVLEANGQPAICFAQIQLGERSFYTEDGHFDMPRAEAASQIEASCEERVSAPVAITPETTSVELRLQEGGILRGHVVGDPEAITVTFLEASGSFVGPDFSMPARLGSGVVTVLARDGRTGRSEVTVTASSPSDVTVTLSASARVTGRILDPLTRAPVVGCAVSFEGDASSSQTDGEGRFVLAHVPLGPNVLSAYAAPKQMLHHQVQVSRDVDVGDLVLSVRK